METCNSCKNKTSLERCTSRPLKGLQFCGKHVRVKQPRLWHIENNIESKVTIISKIWKGYFLRKLLFLAGDGVLRRNICHNSEELISGDEKEKVEPLFYFSFKESGKVWWFDIRSIISCMNQNLKPQNPYTREPLSIETRKRIRYLYNYRLRNKLEVCYDKSIKYTNSAITQRRWTRICQILEENAFEDVVPTMFSTMNKTEFYIFLVLFFNDVKIWAADHKHPGSRRQKYIVFTRNLLAKKHLILDAEDFSYSVAGLLLSLLNDCAEPYPLCFIIMSSLYRL